MLDETKATELKSKHGNVCFLEIAGQEFYFAKPARGAGERYLDRTLGDNCNGQTKREAALEYACACLVHPSLSNGQGDTGALRAALAEEPFLLTGDLFDMLAVECGLGGARQRQKGKL